MLRMLALTSGRNLYHLIKYLSKCPKQLTSMDVEESTSGYFKKEVLNSQFPMLLLFFVSKVYDLKFIYVVDFRHTKCKK